MTQIEKIKAEIERKISSIKNCPFQTADFGSEYKAEGELLAYKDILSFISSLEKESDVDSDKEPELENAFKYYTDRGITISCGELVASPQEPEPQGLEEAIKAFNDTFEKDWKIEGDYVYIPTAKVIASTAFKAGIRWKEKQGVTIKGEIVRHNGSKTLWFDDASLKGLQEFEVGEEIIVQIRKKEAEV